MFKFSRLILVLCVLLLVNSSVAHSYLIKDTVTHKEIDSHLYAKLKSIDGVVAAERMTSTHFAEKYEVVITQLIDPNDPDVGTFTQRFFVMHRGYDLPVVFVTEGYTAKYAERDSYIDEISNKLGCNLVVVEHRYFAESVPDASWEYMTGFNAANDLHKINKSLREIYNNKFITTGISKGGQTTMLYKAYFPNDADISIPYVGPVCFGVEDGRHEPYLANLCGTEEMRSVLLDLQKEVLSRRDKMIPLLEQYAKDKKLEFRDMSLDAVLDYCVLEYPFAFWQWGNDIAKLPSTDASDNDLFVEVVVKSGGADYFANMGDTAPFFVQAAQDLGYYGYDTKPFKKLLTIKNANKYLKKIFLPESAKKLKFDKSLYRDIYHYLSNNDPKMIFIYGEWDPWTAAAPDRLLFEGKTNMMMCVEPEGSHKARIGTLPQKMQDRVWATIEIWLK